VSSSQLPVTEDPVVEIIDAEFVETVAVAEPAAKTAKAEKPPKRHILLRLFGITIWGWIKLIALCVLVGFFILAVEFDPRSSDVDMGVAVQSFLSTLYSVLEWAVLNFWQPALLGGGIVLPIWFVWRLVTLPFRK